MHQYDCLARPGATRRCAERLSEPERGLGLGAVGCGGAARQDVISKVHNHFFVYTNHYLGYLRPINRLVKLANAEVVLVVPKGGQLTAVRSEWVAAAVAAMQQHQSLAIVGMQGVDGTAGSGEIEFMHAVQLDRECPPLFIHLRDRNTYRCGNSVMRGCLLAYGPVGNIVTGLDPARHSGWSEKLA